MTSPAITPLQQRVRQHAERMPDRAAVIAPERILTWAEIDAAAAAAAARLAGLGLQPGDRIGWLGRNGPGFPILLVAARRARLAVAGLNWRLTREELDYIVRHAAPALVFAEDEFRDRLPRDCRVMEVAGLFAAGATFDPRPPSADDPAQLFYTSGTTGKPKGVMYPLAGLEQALVAPTPLEFQLDSVALIVPPVFHIAGGIWTQYALVLGMTQVLLPAATPAAMLDAIERWRVTHTVWVPTLVQMALDEQLRAPRDLGSLQMIGYGAAPMPADLLRRATDTFRCRFVQAYGMTESLTTVCHLPPEEHGREASADEGPPATGFPDPGVGLRIVDTRSGAILGVNQPGEVHLRLPWPRPTYWRLPDGVSSSFDEQGWLHTGDVGLLDKRGCLHLMDRLGDLIISGGENVYPAEVEAVLAALPGVAEAAAYGVDDAHWGQRVCAALVAKPGAQLDSATVIAACRQRLAGYKCPTDVRIVAELPRNATGKVLRRALRERP